VEGGRLRETGGVGERETVNNEPMWGRGGSDSAAIELLENIAL
jgi:hypothetical protein